MVSDTALITLAELRTFPAMAAVPASEDSILEGLINGATAAFEKHWHNIGVSRSCTERVSWSKIREDSRDRNVIWLKNYPVNSVTSITDPDGNTVDSDDYWIEQETGALRTVGSWQIPQDSNGFATYWTVVYNAGRVATTALVPDNIKLAAKMYVATLYSSGANANVASKTIGNLSITYRERESDSDELPDFIQGMISDWVKREV